LYWQWPDGAGGYTTPADLSSVGATSSASVAANGRHPLDAFYRGSNNHLWTSWWDGTWWSAPTDLGGLALGAAPTVVSGGIHPLQVFYIDGQGLLWESHWDGGQWWSAPGQFSVSDVVGQVAAVTHGEHLVEVFYRDSRNRLWRFWSDGGPWSAPVSMRTAISSNPSGATQASPRRAAVFYRDGRGFLQVTDSSNGGSWVSQSTGLAMPGDKLGAISVDEVFVMGTKTPAGTSATGTNRVYRTSS
jgi:hypothetical protein